jgi:DNA polymerase III gamma/tau subunit
MQLVLEARKQTIPDMVARLKVISEAEQLKVSDAALEIIAKKGDRVPRECINILESVAKTYDKEVTLENVRDYLGDVGSDLYIKFFAATNNKLNSSEKEEGKTRIDYALNSAALVDIMNFIAELKLNGTKIPDFIKGLMSFVLDSLYIKHGVNVDEYPPDYVSKIKKVFKYYEAQDFDALIQIIYDVEWKVNTDNDKESEFLLLLTALRISKIKLISNGLSDTLDTAVAENKISMVEHRKALERNRVNLDISEQLKMEMTPATIKEEFDDAAIITEEMEITKPSTVLPSIDPSEYEQLTANKQTATKSNNSNTNEVDNFFDSL